MDFAVIPLATGILFVQQISLQYALISRSRSRRSEGSSSTRRCHRFLNGQHHDVAIVPRPHSRGFVDRSTRRRRFLGYAHGLGPVSFGDSKKWTGEPTPLSSPTLARNGPVFW